MRRDHAAVLENSGHKMMQLARYKTQWTLQQSKQSQTEMPNSEGRFGSVPERLKICLPLKTSLVGLGVEELRWLLIELP